MTSSRFAVALRADDGWLLARKRNNPVADNPTTPRRQDRRQVGLRRTSTSLACRWRDVVTQAFNDSSAADRGMGTVRRGRRHASVSRLSYEAPNALGIASG